MMLEHNDLGHEHKATFTPNIDNPLYKIEYFFENIYKPRWSASCFQNQEAHENFDLMKYKNSYIFTLPNDAIITKS